VQHAAGGDIAAADEVIEDAGLLFPGYLELSRQSGL
jgi:hypothetical protein